MKRVIKNNIFGFIVGAVIFGCLGVIAANAINARDILYRDTNVESAIDNLYQQEAIVDSNYIYSNYVGVSSSSTTNGTNLSLSKGKYVCSFALQAAWINYSSASSFAEGDSSNISSLISGCTTLTPLKYYSGSQGANDKSASIYAHISSTYGNFVCEVASDTQITLAKAGDASSAIPLTYGISCNKIR